MSYGQVLVFNNILLELLTYLRQKFPDDRKIPSVQADVELAVTMCPRQTVSSFTEVSRPYLREISEKNEDFFLNLASESPTFRDLNIAAKWSQLSQADRHNLWKLVQRMVVLGNKIIG